MVKAKVTHTVKTYTITSKELKKFLGIKNPEKISSFGCWIGRSPHDEQSDVDPDTSEEWYVRTEVHIDDGDYPWKDK